MTDDAEGAGFEGDVDEEGNDLMINLAEVEESSFEAIPAGTYNAEIHTLEYKLSKSSGAPMWEAKLRITDGEYENRQLFNYFAFSPKALPMTKGAIAKFAPELLENAFNPKAVAEEGALLGRPLRIKVIVETYQNEPRNRVKSILAAGGESGFMDG